MTAEHSRGHVFVLPGDITHLAVDTWLVPTDKTLHLTAYWQDIPDLAAAMHRLRETASAFAREQTFVLPVDDWSRDEPRPVLTAVPYEGVTKPGQIRERLRQGLTAAAEQAKQSRVTNRALPLVATPAFGTAGGGGDHLRGQLIDELVHTAEAVAGDEGVDVAVVLQAPADLAHVQRKRRNPAAWPELDQDLVHKAAELAKSADHGQLVPFLGAGVSASAGLLLWADLIAQLADEVGLDTQQLGKLNILDRAHILRKRFTEQGGPGRFNESVAGKAQASRYGLAPILLAALPTTEAVTLNYDTLYETACEDVRREVAVLPEHGAEPGKRWLLKLHGTVTDPATIVLTREDYLGYGRGRHALSALAKGLLLTRHLLFVGFGLTDDHFHEIMYDVREVLPAERRRQLGTALVLDEDPLRDELWGADLDLRSVGGADVPEQARNLEIFLDCVLAHTTTGFPFFLNPRYERQLSDAERELRDRLQAFVEQTTPEQRDTSAWRELSRVLDGLGHEPKLAPDTDRS